MKNTKQNSKSDRRKDLHGKPELGKNHERSKPRTSPLKYSVFKEFDERDHTEL